MPPIRHMTREPRSEGAGDAIPRAAGAPAALRGGGEGCANRNRAARVWCRLAARTHSHGFMLVTGVSEPNAKGTPADANSASGLSPAARPAPSRRAYMPVGPPHRASKLGCMLAMIPTPRACSLARGSPSPDVPADDRSGRLRGAEPVDGAFQGIDHDGHGRIADDVETCCHAGFRAGHQVLFGGGGIQVAVARRVWRSVWRVGVGLAQEGGAEPSARRRINRRRDPSRRSRRSGRGPGRRC